MAVSPPFSLDLTLTRTHIPPLHPNLHPLHHLDPDPRVSTPDRHRFEVVVAVALLVVLVADLFAMVVASQKLSRVGRDRLWIQKVRT